MTTITQPISIQVLSDLHLEGNQYANHYTSFSQPVTAPILALLGDIGRTIDSGLFSFLSAQLSRYSYVLFLLGNHEAYGSSYDAARERMREFESSTNQNRESQLSSTGDANRSSGQFVFMDKTCWDVPGTTVSILGCTLFSAIREEQKETVAMYCNDFVGPFGDKSIPGWTVEMHNEEYSRELRWLNEQVEMIEGDRQVIILTHHSPTMLPQANDPMHLKDDKGIQSAFATDLSTQVCWNSKVVKAWAFGHTHFNCDFVVERPGGQLRVIANQKGYARDEKFDFDASKVLMIES